MAHPVEGLFNMPVDWKSAIVRRDSLKLPQGRRGSVTIHFLPKAPKSAQKEPMKKEVKKLPIESLFKRLLKGKRVVIVQKTAEGHKRAFSDAETAKRLLEGDLKLGGKTMKFTSVHVITHSDFQLLANSWLKKILAKSETQAKTTAEEIKAGSYLGSTHALRPMLLVVKTPTKTVKLAAISRPAPEKQPHKSEEKRLEKERTMDDVTRKVENEVLEREQRIKVKETKRAQARLGRLKEASVLVFSKTKK